VISSRPAAATLVLFVRLGGCLDGGVGPDTVVEKEYPDRPPTVNEETAGPYVAAYEEVYRHNVIVREETETIREIFVGAGVVSVRGCDDGYVVVVRVGFYWTFGDDGFGRPAGIADGRPYEATYFVNETQTNRLNDTLAVDAEAAVVLPRAGA
jgi:hypothetical protein